MIKKVLFILPFFCLLLLNQNTIDERQTFFSLQKGIITDECGVATPANYIIQGDELNTYKGNTFCTPGRNVQYSSEKSERLFKITSRQFEHFLQKGQNQLNKTSEIFLSLIP